MDWNAHAWTMMTSLYWSVGEVDMLSEHLYCVAVAFKMTEQVDQRLCIKFYIKLEHSSMETIWMNQKATAGNWWSAAPSQQRACSHITSPAEFCGKTSNPPGDSAPLQPRFSALWLLGFPRTKITFEREEISDHDEIEENIMGQLMAIGRTVWGPKVPTWKWTEASLSCVQCFLYLVSSSVNVSVSHSTWLDTFWTDLVWGSMVQSINVLKLDNAQVEMTKTHKGIKGKREKKNSTNIFLLRKSR